MNRPHRSTIAEAIAGAATLAAAILAVLPYGARAVAITTLVLIAAAGYRNAAINQPPPKMVTIKTDHGRTIT